MFKLKLNNRKLTTDELAELYIKQATQVKKKQEKIIAEWLDQESDFNAQNLINKWEELRKEYGVKFAQEAIKTMAISNSIIDVNNFLTNKMGMDNVTITQDEFFNFLSRLFTVNISYVVIEDCGLPKDIQHDIIERIVDRNFSNRRSQIVLPDVKEE